MVKVTTAVYRLLDSLKWVFNYLHWAELTDYTCLYRFAICYVFEKQSEVTGIFNSSLFHLSVYYSKDFTPTCRIPLAKLYRHLSLLSQDTCVGFRYEFHKFNTSFYEPKEWIKIISKIWNISRHNNSHMFLIFGIRLTNLKVYPQV